MLLFFVLVFVFVFAFLFVGGWGEIRIWYPFSCISTYSISLRVCVCVLITGSGLQVPDYGITGHGSRLVAWLKHVIFIACNCFL